MAAEDRRFPPRERQLVKGRFRIERVADELLDRDKHRRDEIVVFPQTGSPAEMLNQDPAPVDEENLVNCEVPLAQDRGDEDRRQDGQQGEGEDGEDRREIGPQRGWRLDGEEPLVELRTDGAVRHVLVEDGRVDPDRIADRRVGRDDSGEVHVDVFTRGQMAQDEKPRGRAPDFEQRADSDRDAHVVRGQVLDVRRVDIRRDDIRDVHDERDPTSPHGRRGRSGADLKGEDADQNKDADLGDPRGGRASSELDRLSRGNPRSAAGRVRIDDDRHNESVRTTGAEEAALPLGERRVGTVSPARERERNRRIDEDQVRVDGEVHVDELERTAARDVQPDRVPDRLVPLRGATVRREGEGVTRRGRSGQSGPSCERRGTGVEQQCEEDDKTREWVEKRDALNAQVRALVDEATQHRIQRDELNAQVKAAKEERDRYNRRVNDLQDQLSELKRRKLPRGAVPLGKLQQELKRLEFRQMTSVLTVDKERALIDEIQHLQVEVKKLEKSLEENEDVRKMKDELKSARDLAEDAHKRVSELAEKAQAEHDQMTALYEQGDNLRREADRAQEEFIKTKMLADEEHRKHIEHIRQVHDYNKIIHGIWMKSRGVTEEVAEEVDAKKEAELIFERFKKGEKLSTEDLLTLQKSGYL